jgi:ATP-binding protein involved in chromosome partitioning
VTDPRTSIITERLRGIRRVIAVSSGKGGVGKSLIATTLALELANRGYRVGLFDLDFTSPTTHIILGSPDDLRPMEDKGLVPPTICGLEYMSLVYYTSDKPAPLRGEDTSNALIELLAVTRWNELDYLIVDMPPGIGDAVLDLVRLVKNIEFVIVTTPSRLAFETVKKLATLLQELHVAVIGIVENMKMTEEDDIERQTNQINLPYLGEIPFDPNIESAIGRPSALLNTAIAREIRKLISTALKA